MGKTVGFGKDSVACGMSLGRLGMGGIGLVDIGQSRGTHAFRRDHCSLGFCRQHAVEHGTDVGGDFWAKAAQRLVDTQQPVAELGEHGCEPWRGGNALPQILFEAAGEFFVRFARRSCW